MLIAQDAHCALKYDDDNDNDDNLGTNIITRSGKYYIIIPFLAQGYQGYHIIMVFSLWGDVEVLDYLYRLFCFILFHGVSTGAPTATEGPIAPDGEKCLRVGLPSCPTECSPSRVGTKLGSNRGSVCWAVAQQCGQEWDAAHADVGIWPTNRSGMLTGIQSCPLQIGQQY